MSGIYPPLLWLQHPVAAFDSHRCREKTGAVGGTKIAKKMIEVTLTNLSVLLQIIRRAVDQHRGLCKAWWPDRKLEKIKPGQETTARGDGALTLCFQVINGIQVFRNITKDDPEDTAARTRRRHTIKRMDNQARGGEPIP